MVEKAKNTGEATLVFLRVAQEVYGNLPAQNDAAEAQTPQAAQVVEQGQVLTFVVEFSLTRPVSGLEYSIQIYELGGRLAFATTNTELGTPLGALQAGTHEVRCLVAAALPEGEYTASFAFAELANAGSDAGAVHLAALEDACSFRVQLPPERHAQGYMQLPSSLLHQQKSRDVVVASPVLQTASADREGDEWVWEMNAPHPDVELEGFSHFEHWGVWTDGNTARITISSDLIKKINGKYVYLVIKSFPFFAEKKKINILAGLLGKEKFEYVFKKDKNYSSGNILEFPVTSIKDCTAIEIQIKEPASPADFKIGTDNRKLGLGIGKIIIAQNKKIFEIKTVDILSLEEDFSSNNEDCKKIHAYRDNILGSKDILADSLAEVLIKEAGSAKHNYFIEILNAILNLKGVQEKEKNNFIAAAKYIKKPEYINFFDEGPTQENGLNNKKIVNVCGFWYSGSSAVFEYLLGHEEALSITDAGFELKLVNQTYDLLLNFSNNALLCYYIKYLLNFYIPRTITQNYIKSPGFSLVNLIKNNKGLISSEEYSENVLQYVQKMLAHGSEKRKSVFADFLYRCAAGPRFPEKKALVLNQAPNAMEIKNIEAFPSGACCVAVHRDPRDQYLSVKNENENVFRLTDNFTAFDFIKKFLVDRKNFNIKKDELSEKYCFYSVSYEDFVTNPAVRDNLCIELGLTPGLKSQFFNPDVSKKRIGKYKNITDPYLKEQISIIEKELPEYLWHGEVN